MNDFLPIPDSRVILRQGGVYKPAQLFENDSKLFAKSSGGFIRLHPAGTTSHKSISWQDARIQDGSIETTHFYLTWQRKPLVSIAAE
jgi:hypothetical protein